MTSLAPVSLNQNRVSRSLFQCRAFTFHPWIAAIIAMVLCGSADLEAAAESRLLAATFRVDVTPQIGNGPCVGCMPKIDRIEHPLELRGLLLKSGDLTCVMAAVDFCGISNSSDEQIRDAMAAAAGTTRERVALQSLHQHSAPIIDADAVRILHGEDSAELKQHLQFTQKVSSDTAKAIRKAAGELRPVTRIIATRATVDRVASNRRVPQPDGSISVRTSLTRELNIRNAPEGLIDPWLRTLTLMDGEEKIVQLHYYATHPQTFYGDARVSWDAVGMARDRHEKTTKIFQIYFTGCGGNITVGKYNDGTQGAREELASRIQDAMERSSGAVPDNIVELSSLTADQITWKSSPIRFTVREDGPFHPDALRQQLDRKQPFSSRLTASMFSSFGERLRNGHVGQATRLRIGNIAIVHLPGEPFVEFQLFAQRNAAADSFVCVAGYGDCGVWYYGPDHIFTDRGGFEQTWSLTGPCEKKVMKAIEELVR
ncbi:MAG: hypothetical protein ACK526_10715 [Planctomyces sp.]